MANLKTEIISAEERFTKNSGFVATRQSIDAAKNRFEMVLIL